MAVIFVGVVPTFAIAQSLTISAGNFNAAMSYGGSPSPASATYVVANNSGTTVFYPITPYYPSTNFFTVSGAPSSLANGASISIIVNFPASVSTLPPGTYTGAIDLGNAANLSAGLIAARAVVLTISKAAQTVSFSSAAPGAAKVGGATYTPSASATSGLSVALTVDPASAAVCAMSGGIVSFIAAGTCTIDANQAGNANYNAAAQVQQSFTVGKGTQTVNFTSAAPARASVNGSTYTPSASATSGLAVTLTVDAASSSVCAMTGGAVRFLAVGTCTIDANQPGNANYNAATQVQQSFAVGVARTLIVGPADDMVARGNFGGPFSPSSFTYQVSAASSTTTYSITGLPAWLSVSPASGTATTTAAPVVFTVNNAANTLARGTYGPFVITFTSTDGGGGTQSRTATLRIGTTATHDFNGDGKSDIVWRDQAGNIGLWLMNGVSIVGSAGFAGNPLSYGVVGQRDFNGDGKTDLLWRGPNGETVIWLFNGLSATGVAVNQVWPTSWTVAGTGDFDGDGKGDILWRNTTGEIAIWLMNGATIKSNVSLGILTTAYTIVAVGDFDGDGKADIMFRDTNAFVAFWLMNGTAVKSAAQYNSSIGTAWSIVGTGDFNGDGKADIVFRDTSGYIAIWLMNGTTIADSGVLGPLSTAYTIVETGDFNGDGKSDILFRDTQASSAVWYMNGKAIGSSATVPDPGASWTLVGKNAD